MPICSGCGMDRTLYPITLQEIQEFMEEIGGDPDEECLLCVQCAERATAYDRELIQSLKDTIVDMVF